MKPWNTFVSSRCGSEAWLIKETKWRRGDKILYGSGNRYPHTVRLLITRAGSQPSVAASLSSGAQLFSPGCGDDPACSQPLPRKSFLPSPGATFCTSIVLTPNILCLLSQLSGTNNPRCLLQNTLSGDFSSSRFARSRKEGGFVSASPWWTVTSEAGMCLPPRISEETSPTGILAAAGAHQGSAKAGTLPSPAALCFLGGGGKEREDLKKKQNHLFLESKSNNDSIISTQFINP